MSRNGDWGTEYSDGALSRIPPETLESFTKGLFHSYEIKFYLLKIEERCHQPTAETRWKLAGTSLPRRRS